MPHEPNTSILITLLFRYEEALVEIKKLNSRSRHLQGGRPRKFDTATEQRLRTNFRRDVRAWEKQWGETLKANSKQARSMVDILAAREGVSASFSVLRDRIVYPVLRELRRRESH
jgi:hypothetical protein